VHVARPPDVLNSTAGEPAGSPINEKVKEIGAKVKLFQRSSVPIDAPR
jgi:hypothetical protein